MRLRSVLKAAAALLGVLATGALPACTPMPGATPDTTPQPLVTAFPGADGPGSAPGPGIFPLVPATHEHVQRRCPLFPAVHYDPDEFATARVVRAYVCTTAPWSDAPDGTPQIQEFVDRVADEDIPRLLDAYAVPDAERPGDIACELSLHDPLIVWLHTGDGWITPVHAPRDECGFPTPAASAVYESLDLHRVLVAREKLRSE